MTSLPSQYHLIYPEKLPLWSDLEACLKKLDCLPKPSDFQSQSRFYEYWDSFDGRLAAEQRIIQDEPALKLRRLLALDQTPTTLFSLRWPPTKARRSERAKAVQTLETMLTPWLKSRALLKIMSVTETQESRVFFHASGQSFEIQQQTFLAMSPYARQTSTQSVGHLLELKLKEGAPDFLQMIMHRVLESFGGASESVIFDYFHLASLLQVPRNRSKPPALTYAPQISLAEGAILALRHYKTIMERHYQGTLEGWDTEFLHDFRVALRHVRSLFRLFRKAFVPQEGSPFNEELRWLGQMTGPLRDCDVALESFPILLQQIAESEHPALLIYRDYLRVLNQEERILLQNALISPQYTQLMAHFEEFLQTASASESGQRPLSTAAGSLLRKSFQRVLREGSLLQSDSPPEAFHQLRILCKRLRYALDALKSLFHSETDRFLSELKQLQEVLGHFQDATIHEAQLREVLPQFTDLPQSAEFYLAMGQVIGAYRHQRHQARQEFEAVWARFSSPTNVQLFERLLTGLSSSHA